MRTLDAFGFDNCTMIFIRIVVAVLLLFFGILIIDKSMLKIKARDIWGVHRLRCVRYTGTEPLL